MEVAARAAFWELPRSTVYDFAKYYDLRVSGSATLFELLWEFCEKHLKVTAEEILQIIDRRVAIECSATDAADKPSGPAQTYQEAWKVNCPKGR